MGIGIADIEQEVAANMVLLQGFLIIKLGDKKRIAPTRQISNAFVSNGDFFRRQRELGEQVFLGKFRYCDYLPRTTNRHLDYQAIGEILQAIKPRIKRRRAMRGKMGEDKIMDSNDKRTGGKKRDVEMRKMNQVETFAPQAPRQLPLFLPGIPRNIEQDLMDIRIFADEFVIIIAPEKDDKIERGGIFSRLTGVRDLDHIVDHFLGITPQSFADRAVEAGIDSDSHDFI